MTTTAPATTVTTSATYTKLNSGEWGLRVSGPVEAGQTLIVSKRDTTTKRETVGRVLHTADGASICTIAAVAAVPVAASAAPRPSRGFRTCSYCDRRVPREALCCGDGE